jgi:TM2 domain-containing membrane protein YozV
MPNLMILLAASIPLSIYYLALQIGIESPKGKAGIAATTGIFSILSGAASAFYGYYTFVRKIDSGIAGRIFAPLGAGIFLYGTFAMAYLVSVVTFEALLGLPQSSYLISALGDLLNETSLRGYAQLVCVVFLLLGLSLLVLSSINIVGLHRFYRDRLMEAFLPTFGASKFGRATYSPVADRLLLSDLKSSYLSTNSTSPAVPYILINTLGRVINNVHRRTITRGATTSYCHLA